MVATRMMQVTGDEVIDVVAVRHRLVASRPTLGPLQALSRSGNPDLEVHTVFKKIKVRNPAVRLSTRIH